MNQREQDLGLGLGLGLGGRFKCNKLIFSETSDDTLTCCVINFFDCPVVSLMNRHIRMFNLIIYFVLNVISDEIERLYIKLYDTMYA